LLDVVFELGFVVSSKKPLIRNIASFFVLDVHIARTTGLVGGAVSMGCVSSIRHNEVVGSDGGDQANPALEGSSGKGVPVEQNKIPSRRVSTAEQALGPPLDVSHLTATATHPADSIRVVGADFEVYVSSADSLPDGRNLGAWARDMRAESPALTRRPLKGGGSGMIDGRTLKTFLDVIFKNDPERRALAYNCELFQACKGFSPPFVEMPR
jgi:hypothetical protein